MLTTFVKKLNSNELMKQTIEMALSQLSASYYYSRIQVVLSAPGSLSFETQLWTKDFTASRQGNAYQRLRSRLDIALFHDAFVA